MPKGRPRQQDIKLISAVKGMEGNIFEQTKHSIYDFHHLSAIFSVIVALCSPHISPAATQRNAGRGGSSLAELGIKFEKSSTAI